MNILIPHTWLLEHLATDATPLQIQALLSHSGPSVERIHEIEGEPVYDIEVTTNRVDSMSVRGIAREAAVILSQASYPSSLLQFAPILPAVGEDSLPLPVIHNNPALCRRIMCVILKDVQKRPSPEWMQKRLRQVGINTHDAVIDTTNYITHALGHPCHAFDYDKVMALGGVIHVKEAEKGKAFSIIDGTEFVTVGGEVVFENDRGEIIDLPAIKGTKNSAITDDTRNVLFWIESLDAAKVRFASMTHAIRTVAAQLNEKNVDPELADDTLRYGAELLCQLAGGKVASTVYDDFPSRQERSILTFSLFEVPRYLGQVDDLTPDRIISILESLGCIVTRSGDSLTIKPPTYRPDLSISADIVEEIARIYGYHRLASRVMQGEIPTKNPDSIDLGLEQSVRETLSALGGFEVYTYSMIDENTKQIESDTIANSRSDSHLRLANPLTEDMVYLRRTLWASHCNVLGQNTQYKDVVVYEFANTYIPTDQAVAKDRELRNSSLSKDKQADVLPYERFHLTITARTDERRIKGIFEAICRKHYLPSIRYVRSSPSTHTAIMAGELQIGEYLQIQRQQQIIHVLDIDWASFRTASRRYPIYTAPSKFTPIIEDLTFTIPVGAKIQEIIDTISQVPHVQSVRLTTQYQQNSTFTLTYEAGDHQLTGDEASITRKMVVETVQSTHNATLIGSV